MIISFDHVTRLWFYSCNTSKIQCGAVQPFSLFLHLNLCLSQFVMCVFEFSDVFMLAAYIFQFVNGETIYLQSLPHAQKLIE